MRVTVIGAGIIGTTTAYRLKKRFPDLEISLVADLFSPNTTSDLAAGWWEPHLDPDTPAHLVEKWSIQTYNLLLSIWRSSPDQEIHDIANDLKQGISLTTGTCVDSSGSDLNPSWSRQVINYAVHTQPTDMTRLGFSESASMFAYSFLSFTMEPRIVLPVFYRWLEKNGVQLQERKVLDLREVLRPEGLVVNCTGLGAAELDGDTALYPISGHVVRAKISGLNHCLADNREETWAYLIPNRECTVLGSVDTKENWSTTVIHENTEKILKSCQAICPLVKEAEMVSELVGLRPCRRGGVRLHLETRPRGKVIHNYGHGGSGVTLSWGCAGEVVDILHQLLESQQI